MNIKVRLHAMLREIAGTDVIEIPLDPDRATTAAIFESLVDLSRKPNLVERFATFGNGRPRGRPAGSPSWVMAGSRGGSHCSNTTSTT